MSAFEFDPGGFQSYLAQHENKDLLRFLTCGSVDDGKSTLIGRLLYDTKLLFEDQLATLAADSRKHGTVGEDIDFALLVDGLEAEREQGITIDVAYRFFATDNRKFIVADTPGHEQYTRNMATGASTADVAVILIDARKGVLTQTRRHAYIASLLGIRRVIVAVNKIDLMQFDESVFGAIKADFESLALNLGFVDTAFIPLSARFGDNVTSRSPRMPWYAGPTLLEYLETVEISDDAEVRAFRMPVQWVNRPNLNFRGFAGLVASGQVKSGDEVVALPSGRTSRVKEIVVYGGPIENAQAGEAVTITLEDEIDISRGDVLAAAADRPEISDQFAAHLVWMNDAELVPGRSYSFKFATKTVAGSVTEIKHKVDVNTLQHLAAKVVGLNEVASVNIALNNAIAFEPYAVSRALGSFIVIDRTNNLTVGAGTIDFGLRRGTNVHWQALDVNKAARSHAKAQRPAAIWLTGLSGAGKSTIANLVERQLHVMGKHTYLLDGDNVRHGLNKDLGFTEVDRVENIRRVAEMAKLMVDAGLLVFISLISPYRAERAAARELFEPGEFVEVFVDTPIDIAEARDPKGLYGRARRGEIKNFTGIDSPYEAPLAPELVLQTATDDAETLAARIVAYLADKGHLS